MNLKSVFNILKPPLRKKVETKKAAEKTSSTTPPKTPSNKPSGQLGCGFWLLLAASVGGSLWYNHSENQKNMASIAEDKLALWKSRLPSLVENNLNAKSGYLSRLLDTNDFGMFHGKFLPAVFAKKVALVDAAYLDASSDQCKFTVPEEAGENGSRAHFLYYHGFYLPSYPDGFDADPAYANEMFFISTDDHSVIFPEDFNQGIMTILGTRDKTYCTLKEPTPPSGYKLRYTKIKFITNEENQFIRIQVMPLVAEKQGEKDTLVVHPFSQIWEEIKAEDNPEKFIDLASAYNNLARQTGYFLAWEKERNIQTERQSGLIIENALEDGQILKKVTEKIIRVDRPIKGKQTACLGVIAPGPRFAFLDQCAVNAQGWTSTNGIFIGNLSGTALFDYNPVDVGVINGIKYVPASDESLQSNDVYNGPLVPGIYVAYQEYLEDSLITKNLMSGLYPVTYLDTMDSKPCFSFQDALKPVAGTPIFNVDGQVVGLTSGQQCDETVNFVPEVKDGPTKEEAHFIIAPGYVVNRIK